MIGLSGLAELALPQATQVRALRTPVVDLRWVRLEPRPGHLTACRGTPSALKGLRFERAVGRALAPLAQAWPATQYSGQWLRFCAANGPDWAQPDHYLVLRDRVLLLECKLSQTPAAWHQLDRVYAPLLRRLYGLPIVAVGVFNYLVAAPEGPVNSLGELALGGTPARLEGHRFTLHLHDPRRLT